MKARTSIFLALFGSSLAAACGGASSTGSGTVTGTATKGPVAGASVVAYAIANGAMGAPIGSATTDATGSFSVPVGSYAGPVMLRLGGGAYLDEATGSTMAMLSGDVMEACLPSVAAGATTTGIQVTPLTSMACARAKGMNGGMTAGNVAAANAGMGSYFSVSDVLHVMPMNPLATGSGTGATQDMKNYGMAIAAMSQYASTIGMTASSSGMVTAMMDDASDGIMNGMMGATGISMMGMGGMMGGMMQSTAGTTGLGTALGTFVGSAMNHSGVTLTEMQPLIDHLNTSGGVIP